MASSASHFRVMLALGRLRAGFLLAHLEQGGVAFETVGDLQPGQP